MTREKTTPDANCKRFYYQLAEDELLEACRAGEFNPEVTVGGLLLKEKVRNWEELGGELGGVGRSLATALLCLVSLVKLQGMRSGE